MNYLTNNMGKDYKTLKAKAWIYYKSWMKEKTYSPALKSEIKITRKGWDHMFGGNRSKHRSIKDRINRISLLKSAKYIIKNQTKYSITKEKDMEYISLNQLIQINGKNTNVRVILVKDRKNNIEFLSVMKK